MHRLVARLSALPIGRVVALTPLLTNAAPAPAQAPDAATRIDSYLRGRMPGLRTPGFSIVVVQDD